LVLSFTACTGRFSVKCYTVTVAWSVRLSATLCHCQYNLIECQTLYNTIRYMLKT
jgi:hypothetical protein